MKQFLTVFLILCFYSSFAQDSTLVKYQSYFNGSLNDWCKSYNQFDITKFKFTVSYNFETVNYRDEKNGDSFRTDIDSFYTLYKPLLAYSPNGNCFLDIYSYWLNLEKKGDKIVVNADAEQAAVLCDYKNKTATRILFCGLQSGIEEAIWVSDTQFLLCCFDRKDSDKPLPFVILGDTERKVFWFYDVPGTNCYQVKDYTKEKLKKAGIEME